MHDDTPPRPVDARRAGAVAATVTLVGGAILLNGRPVEALQFEVTSLSGSNAVGTLRWAVDRANATGGPDRIVFSGAAAAGTIDLGGNTLQISDAVEIQGPGSGALTLTNSSGSLVYVTDYASLSMSGVTIADADGRAIDVAAGDEIELDDVRIERPGNDGISVRNASNVALDDVTVADSNDMGVSLRNVDTVSVVRSVVTDSGKRGIEIFHGGGVSLVDTDVSDSGYEGVYVDGTGASGETAVISDVSIERSGRHGLYLRGEAAFDLTDVDVSDSARTGVLIKDDPNAISLTRVTVDLSRGGEPTDGGIVVDDEKLSGADPSDVDFDAVTITNTTGPAVSVVGADDVMLLRTLVSGATTQGVATTNSSSLQVHRSTITGVGSEAVAVQNLGVSGVDLLSTTISGNDVITPYLVRATDADVSVRSTTISANVIDNGTAVIGLDGSSDLNVAHSIVAANDGAISHSGGSSVAGGWSLVEPGSGLPGTGVVQASDPQLGPLQDNSGPTPTMFPDAGSPVIGGGNPGFAGFSSVDQRGVARVVGVIDIGAVEVNNGEIVVADASVREDAGSVEVTIRRRGAADVGAASVDVETVNGSARAGSDFTAVSTRLSWGPGESSARTVSIPIIEDPAAEPTETFSVVASNPVGSAIVDGTGVVTIVDTVTGSFGPAITSLAPQRFVDTRPGQATIDGQFAGAGKRDGGTEYRVRIAGRGDVPADAVGVVMNVTAVDAESNGFVTAHPCVAPRPTASSLNYTAGVNLGNEIVAGLSTGGDVCLFTRSRAHLTVDVVGFVSADSPLTPLTPARVLETRPGLRTVDREFETGSKTTAGGTITLDVAGRAGVPADAAAVIVNVTAVDAAENGFVTVSPCVTPRPTASSLNHVAGVNRGNELIASLDAAGRICLFTRRSIDLTVDVVGYVPVGSNLRAVDPARLLDTRPGQSTTDGVSAGEGKRAGGSTYTLQITGRGSVPAGASAAIVNVTAVEPEANGFVTVSPCVTPRPTASSLNYVAGVNGGNEIVARLTSDGAICLFTRSRAHLTVDVVGYLD